LELFQATDPDLVLLDLHMPGLDGFQFMEAIRPLSPEGHFLPIVILSGDQDPDVRDRALASGARDFVNKPFRPSEVVLRIRNMLEIRFLHCELRSHNEILEDRVKERTKELAQAQMEILDRLALTAEYRDDCTGQHTRRVGELSARLAEAMTQPRATVELLRQAAPLHDLGKVAIPDAILLKPGPLSDPEYSLMASHTDVGGGILAGSQFPLLQMAREIAETHHEKWNGSGYKGLTGDDIPLTSRIVAVADAFDCMVHERPYKVAASLQEAVEEVVEQRGLQFDPRVVDAFVGLAKAGRVQDLLPEAQSDAPGGRLAQLAKLAAATGTLKKPAPVETDRERTEGSRSRSDAKIA
jgi:putative two-component system response regulator